MNKRKTIENVFIAVITFIAAYIIARYLNG